MKTLLTNKALFYAHLIYGAIIVLFLATKDIETFYMLVFGLAGFHLLLDGLFLLLWRPMGKTNRNLLTAYWIVVFCMLPGIFIFGWPLPAVMLIFLHFRMTHGYKPEPKRIDVLDAAL